MVAAVASVSVPSVALPSVPSEGLGTAGVLTGVLVATVAGAGAITNAIVSAALARRDEGRDGHELLLM